MNTSDAFSDYMVSYSVNRSINLSPTMGRLHKNRETGSLGPTICLINRSREKIEESTTVDEKQKELVTKLLMLSMEIERLTEENRQLKQQREEKSSIDRLKQASVFKEENQKLRMNIQRHQTLRTEMEKKYNNQIYELREKISACEAENRTLNRRVRENQKELQEIQLKGKITQSMASRAKMEASRMEMSMRFDSTNADLHKSIAKEKTMEAQSMREKVQRCEEIIRDQKFIINGQKQQINKEKGRQTEIEQMYLRELQFLRKQLELSQRESSQINQDEVKKLQTQIRDWQSRVVQSQEQLKQKCLIIANQVKTINELESRCHELERLLQDLQFNHHSHLVRAEEATKLANKERDRQSLRLNKEMNKCLQEIEMLKTVIDQYKLNIAERDNEAEMTTFEMRTRLKEKEQEVRKLRRRDRVQQSQGKGSKSLSVDNFNIAGRLKASQVNLGHIVDSMMQLKDSADRSTRILGKSLAMVKETYYAK